MWCIFVAYFSNFPQGNSIDLAIAVVFEADVKLTSFTFTYHGGGPVDEKSAQSTEFDGISVSSDNSVHDCISAFGKIKVRSYHNSLMRSFSDAKSRPLDSLIWVSWTTLAGII